MVTCIAKMFFLFMQVLINIQARGSMFIETSQFLPRLFTPIPWHIVVIIVLTHCCHCCVDTLLSLLTEALWPTGLGFGGQDRRNISDVYSLRCPKLCITSHILLLRTVHTTTPLHRKQHGSRNRFPRRATSLCHMLHGILQPVCTFVEVRAFLAVLWIVF